MKEIQLTQGKVAIVDDEDFEYVSEWKWYAKIDKRTSYALRWFTEDGKQSVIRMHNLILGCLYVDHINGNGLDNRRENLRTSTHQQNCFNRKINLNSTSGFKGVSWSKSERKWKVYIKVGGKKNHLGYFDSLVRAACAYDDAARELHGEFARTNFLR